ncbi:MAG: alpha/beta hydrolase, partial [Deltaproteobacteria bacterium]|nr:alpha/beta hydrolase [Deltaproteobacteria bacterium]
MTRTCAYDRPGMDWSEPIGRTVDAGEVAVRLHRLVEVAGIPGPYVLVGMSAGGVYVREYQRNHPGGIVGMVLVDSSHEQQGSRLPEISGAANIDRMLSLCSWLQ